MSPGAQPLLPEDLLLWDWDPETGDLKVSAAARPSTASSVAANEWHGWVHPDDLPRVLAALEAASAEGVPLEIEHRVRLGSGDWHRGVSRGRAAAATGRRPVVGVLAGASVREAARAEAAALAFQHTAFFRDAPVAIAMLDREMRYLNFSRRWLADYGLDENAVLGRSHYEIFPEIPERWREVHRRCLAGAVEHCDDDSFTRADGTEMWVHWEVAPWFDGAGAIGGIVILTEDVTAKHLATDELRRSREAAEAAGHAKATFLANMGHEIRTPMNGILGMAELALETSLTDQQRDQIETIVSCGRTLLTILDDILDLSKLEAGKVALSPVPFAVRPWLRRLLSLLEKRARERGLRLCSEVAAEVPELLVGDEVRLGQVLLNLAGNAVKFTPEGGEVTVLLERLPGGDGRCPLRLSVHDTGIGIESDKLAAIFEPFEQADPSTTRRFGGTGLGLSIVRQLVELMGGKVSVESAPGAGSTFRIDLTLAIAEQAPAPRRGGASDRVAATASPEVRGLRVLLVEDNPDNRKIANLILEREGCRVRDVADGRAAVDAFRADRGAIDLVLMDCLLPVMNGWEATREIRAVERERGGHVPIVALTANAMEGDRERCLAAGMDDYLSKPIDRARLRRVLVAAARASRRCEPGSEPNPPSSAVSARAS